MTEEEQKEFLNELNSFGYEFKKVLDVLTIGIKDKILVPVLLKWFEKPIVKLSDKIFIVRCLTVKGFNKATEILLKFYKELDYEEIDKWTVGNAIGVISDRRYVNDYIKIITNKKNGISRQMIVHGMGAFKEEKVKRTLIILLNDEEVNGHVIYALSKFKDKNLIQILIPFLEHKVIWKREEAKKAIKKLEKLDK